MLDGLHQDAHEGNFQAYFARYTKDGILGTDKTDAGLLKNLKLMQNLHLQMGMAELYSGKRNWEGGGNTRWFDEILFNEKLGRCRGTGVVKLIDSEWKIVLFFNHARSKLYCC